MSAEPSTFDLDEMLRIGAIDLDDTEDDDTEPSTAELLELAAGIEHERQVYRRCVALEHDLREQLQRIEDRRLDAFGNLAVFGRSPFVPEWMHHLPPSDPATDEAFARLVVAA